MNGYGNPYGMPYGYDYMQGRGIPPNIRECHIEQVEGEQGVRNAPMPPNSDKIFLDKSSDMIWLAKTDEYGMKYVVQPYDIIPHKTKESTQYDELSARMARLEDALNEFLTPSTSGGDAKSEPIYATTSKPSKPNKANG